MRLTNRKLLLAAFAASVLFAAPAHAQFSGSATRQDPAAATPAITIGGAAAPAAPTGAPLSVPANGQVGIAVPAFTYAADNLKPVAEQFASLINADLKLSGAFDTIADAKFIQRDLSISAKPNFTDWTSIGAQAVLVGFVQAPSPDSLNIQFRLFDTASGAQLIGKQYSIPVADLWRRTAHKIADDIFAQITSDAGFFDSRITYVSEPTGATMTQSRLGVMDQDGANTEQLLSTGVVSLQVPRWSPDGNTIMYSADAPVPGKASAIQLTTILYSLTSGRREPLIEKGAQPNADARFSPDGRSVIFSRTTGGNSDIFLLDLATRSEKRLTTAAGADTSPAISPDGNTIVFVSDRTGSPALFAMRIDGAEMACPTGERQTACRLTRDDGKYANPVWSPRGDAIAFSSGGIGIIKPDGSGKQMLTTTASDNSPAFSPNGRMIAFARESNGGKSSKLFAINTSGQNLRPLPTPAEAYQPDWSGLSK